jgi:hypothetical protein
MSSEIRVQDMLEELARQDQALNAPAHVEVRVMAAMRGRHPRPGRWLGVAAALALASAISWLVPTPKSQQAKTPGGARQEITTGYFPLRAGPLLDPGELGQVVRISVPRHELYRHGIELMGSGGNSETATVRADVLIGMDGTQRAIRFVH